MRNVFIEKCENCKFSLINAKGNMECRYEHPLTGKVPYPLTTPIDWCGKYVPTEKREDMVRKDAYAEALVQVEAEKVAAKASIKAAAEAATERVREAGEVRGILAEAEAEGIPAE